MHDANLLAIDLHYLLVIARDDRIIRQKLRKGHVIRPTAITSTCFS